jgi:hypothetical protein
VLRLVLVEQGNEGEMESSIKINQVTEQIIGAVI